MDTGEIYYLFLGDIEIYEEQTFQFHFLPGYAFITCNIVTNSILVVVQWPYFRIRSHFAVCKSVAKQYNVHKILNCYNLTCEGPTLPWKWVYEQEIHLVLFIASYQWEILKTGQTDFTYCFLNWTDWESVKIEFRGENKLRTSMLLWYSNPIHFILARKVLHLSFNSVWQKSQFPAIHCLYWQEKFRMSLESPWRDTKKLRFPGTIREINLGIIFQTAIFPTTVGSLPKPSHWDVTLTFPDLQPCVVPRAGPSPVPQQGDLPVSLWFLLSPGAQAFGPCFTQQELVITSRLSLLVTAFSLWPGWDFYSISAVQASCSRKGIKSKG